MLNGEGVPFVRGSFPWAACCRWCQLGNAASSLPSASSCSALNRSCRDTEPTSQFPACCKCWCEALCFSCITSLWLAKVALSPAIALSQAVISTPAASSFYQSGVLYSLGDTCCHILVHLKLQRGSPAGKGQALALSEAQSCSWNC